MSRPIRAINLIPVGDTYYPTEKLSDEDIKYVSQFTDKAVSAEPISKEDHATWKKRVIEKVTRSLQQSYEIGLL